MQGRIDTFFAPVKTVISDTGKRKREDEAKTKAGMKLKAGKAGKGVKSKVVKHK